MPTFAYTARTLGGDLRSATIEAPSREDAVLALRKLLWRNGVLVHAEDVGGSRVSRTVYLDAATGALRVRATGPAGPRDFTL